MLDPIPFLLAASLITTANCAPGLIDAGNPELNPSISEAFRHEDFCSDSSLENASSTGSPKAQDCRIMAANIANGGDWTTTLSRQRTLASYGTCAFGVKSAGRSKKAAGDFIVGNQDIVDLVNESIKRFEWKGLVGAKGKMRCSTGLSDDWLDVTWGLYHAK